MQYEPLALVSCYGWPIILVVIPHVHSVRTPSRCAAMNAFEILQQQVESLRCPRCKGKGQHPITNDPFPDQPDVVCAACHETGVKKGRRYEIVKRRTLWEADCAYCDGKGEIEMDNNGPIGVCPICKQVR